MGERADAMRPEEIRGDMTPPANRVNATPGDATESEDPEEIREEIEQTRAELSETIEAIQERLAPERLTEQAKEVVREATVGRVEQAVSSATEPVRETATSFIDTIKQNPLPAAMAAVGIGWLFMNRRSSSAHGTQYAGQSYTPASYRRSYDTYDRGQTYSYSGQPRGTSYGGSYGQRSGQQSGDDQGMVDQVGEIASQAKEQVTGLASQMQEQVGQYTEQARRAPYQLQDMLRENPLAVGAIALGLGAAVGLAVPTTEKEGQVLGEAREEVMDRAQEMAQQTMQKVQNVMGDVKEAAQQSAQDEGLAPS